VLSSKAKSDRAKSKEAAVVVSELWGKLWGVAKRGPSAGGNTRKSGLKWN